MSGIYGIYRYDGAPVDPSWLDRMRNAMAYYGPDGGNSKIDGPVGMGHLLLSVNPEDEFEQQPYRVPRGMVTCAARLDNRDFLLDAFGISTAEAPHVSDGRLVSLAFERWGEDVCPHLEGDWSLAAWDTRERRLFLAMNACGNESFYYYQGKGFIAFASSLKALLALPGVVKEPDLLRLAEVLAVWQHDAELTAYKGFRRLLWAHAMTVDDRGMVQIRRHWSPEGRELLRYKRGEEYVEQFLDLYTRAVKSCLRSRKTIAAQLSGGRDSGSVVALAAPMLAEQGRELPVFTAVPAFAPDGADETRLGDEWDLATATAQMAGPNVRHVRVDAKDYGVIAGIEYMLNIHDGPGHAAGNHYWVQAALEASSSISTRALLTGNMGNGTISWSGNGSALLALRQKNPATALQLFLHGEANSWQTIRRQIIKPILTPSRRVLGSLRTGFRRPWQSYSALNVDTADCLRLEERMRAAGHDPTFTNDPLRDLRLWLFGSLDVGLAVATLAEMGASQGCAILDPTVNLSMFEFLLRVPDDQFYWRGYSSYLFQRAFTGRLPDPVVRGNRKGLQAADLGHRILRELPQFRECIGSLESLPEARKMLDIPLMRKCLDDLTVRVDPVTTDTAMCILTPALGVGLFLRRLANSN